MFSCFASHTQGVAIGVCAVLTVAACGSADIKPYDEAAPVQAGASAGTTGTGPSGGNAGSSGGTGGAGVNASGGTGGDAAGTAGTTLVTGGSGNAAGASGTGTGGSASGGASGGLGGTGGDMAQAGEAGSAGGSDGGEGGAPFVDCSGHGETAHDFGGHCYQYSAEHVTWRQAHDDCESRNGHLVTISSEGRNLTQFLAENAFVWGLATEAEVWIGATDGKGPHQKGDGTFFEWDDGEPMTLDNWSGGQPNNSQTACDADPCSCDDGACYEHCGFLWNKAGKQEESVPGWNDRLCDHRIGFVCEWD